MMKQWKEPEMSVFSVRMTENIADSGVSGGDGGDVGGYVVQELNYLNSGGVNRGSGNYRCKGTVVQDTVVSYFEHTGWAGGQYYAIYETDMSTVSGCLVT